MQHHDHKIEINLSFQEKIVKLLEHWIKHNTEHADNYRNWARQAKEQNLETVALLIQDAALLTGDINSKFEKALLKINKT